MEHLSLAVALASNSTTTIRGIADVLNVSCPPNCSSAKHLRGATDHLDSTINMIDDAAEDLGPHLVNDLTLTHDAYAPPFPSAVTCPPNLRVPYPSQLTGPGGRSRSLRIGITIHLGKPIQLLQPQS